MQLQSYTDDTDYFESSPIIVSLPGSSENSPQTNLGPNRHEDRDMELHESRLDLGNIAVADSLVILSLISTRKVSLRFQK